MEADNKINSAEVLHSFLLQAILRFSSVNVLTEYEKGYYTKNVRAHFMQIVNEYNLPLYTLSSQ